MAFWNKKPEKPQYDLSKDIFRTVSGNDLYEYALFYPHIPKAVNRLLQERNPSNYHSRAYTNLIQEGAWIRKGEVIARYHDIQITSPFDGRLELIGYAAPGLHEWPTLQGAVEEHRTIGNYSAQYSIIQNTMSAPSHVYDPLNDNKIVFPPQIPFKAAYSFAMRPLKVQGDRYGNFENAPVSAAFDYGSSFRDIKRQRDASTFFSIIDMAVLEVKASGHGTPLPPSLKNDEPYKQELARYWSLINQGFAMRRRNVTDPAPTSSPHIGEPR